ncbi:ClpP family protease [uncultured Eubacterium sp.]|mgnify:CR=1 FL=1|uniref:ClpP family protease n=1 Tax=uncultured Eubacterium sp. TaxID=165185 RepID=UPI002671F895|nr:ATP-dependent Clp protease proteolytic subunit [uncultured Eubacterium sp.]
MDEIKEYGQTDLDNNKKHKKIHLLSIIGEIEGHENVASGTKATKYEHVLPQLAQVEDDCETEGLLVIINTVGGDVECGLAIAEMIASLSKPTVSLVLGGSHSIGVPLAVSTNHSFIVETGTMVVHPVRMNGMFIGVPQTYEYFKKIQERINWFVVHHCDIKESRFTELMMETEVMTKDVGSILIGKQAVKEGIIDEIGGLKEAMKKLYELIDEDNKKSK